MVTALRLLMYWCYQVLPFTKALLSFLGLVNYYHQRIPDCSYYATLCSACAQNTPENIEFTPEMLATFFSPRVAFISIQHYLWNACLFWVSSSISYDGVRLGSNHFNLETQHTTTQCCSCYEVVICNTQNLIIKSISESSPAHLLKSHMCLWHLWWFLWLCGTYRDHNKSSPPPFLCTTARGWAHFYEWFLF